MKRERRPWLPLVLLLCLIGMVLASTVIGFGRPPVQDLAGAFWPDQVQTMLWYLTCGATGTLILWHRPRNILGWILAAEGLLIGLDLLAFEYAYFTQVRYPGALPMGDFVAWLDASLSPYGLVLLVLLVLLFPTGQPHSRRWGWVLWLVAAGALDFGVLAILLWPFRNQTFVLSEHAPSTGHIDVINSAGFIMLLPAFGLATISLILRFWRAKGDERQQLKWLAYALTLFIVASAFRGVVLGILLRGRWDIPGWLVNLGGLAIPVSIGVAVLKYRLYDIDVLIRRTIRYGVLTGLLALIYLGSVVSLQEAFTLISGQRSALAVVLSTLVIAALFNPLRRRVQELIDRRFYRSKYNADQALAAFAAAASDETDLDSLVGRLVEVVQGTVQPAHVSIWLSRAPGPKRVQKP